MCKHERFMCRDCRFICLLCGQEIPDPYKDRAKAEPAQEAKKPASKRGRKKAEE